MKSLVSAIWISESPSKAIALETHLLDFVNSGLIKLQVSHVDEAPMESTDPLDSVSDEPN